MESTMSDAPCLFCDEPCSTRRRSEEDGNRIRPDGPCEEYRPYCPAPGYCWCGHWCAHHADYPKDGGVR
jgi:hypothetical protein